MNQHFPNRFLTVILVSASTKTISSRPMWNNFAQTSVKMGKSVYHSNRSNELTSSAFERADGPTNTAKRKAWKKAAILWNAHKLMFVMINVHLLIACFCVLISLCNDFHWQSDLQLQPTISMPWRTCTHSLSLSLLIWKCVFHSWNRVPMVRGARLITAFISYRFNCHLPTNQL